jgi:putative ABC transport system substrate-binding protein
VAVEARWADNQYDRLPALAADLVSRGVAVIYAGSLVASLAAKAATGTTPIVFGVGADPVKSGLVASFNRPGANVTGVAALIESLGPKRLELLHELLLEVPVFNMLVNASNPTAQAQAGEILAAAQTIVQRLQVVNVSGKSELEGAFSTLAQQGARGLLVVPEPVLINSRGQSLHWRHAIQFRPYIRCVNSLMSVVLSVTEPTLVKQIAKPESTWARF